MFLVIADGALVLLSPVARPLSAAFIPTVARSTDPPATLSSPAQTQPHPPRMSAPPRLPPARRYPPRPLHTTANAPLALRHTPAAARSQSRFPPASPLRASPATAHSRAP